MIKKMQIIENLSEEQVKQLIAHFNTVYECKELNEMEQNIIYLAWLWANGKVYECEDGMLDFHDEDDCVSIMDYDLCPLGYEPNTINLEVTYSIFEINKIIDIMKLKSNE